MKAREIVRLAGVYLALVTLASAFMLPVAWMLSATLHDGAGVFAQPYEWIPAAPQWDTWPRALEAFSFGRALANTVLITVPTMLFTVLSCALVAYGFARLRFAGRDLLFALCIATMMLPGQVTMIPLYMMFAKIGWVDTLLPLIVPSLFGSPFYIFLLRQFFMTIPRDIDDAARIDGASRLRIWWSIVLPQARPALATVLVFTFIGSWNDFLGPLIYINSPDHATLTLGLSMMKTQLLGTGVVEWNVLMAAALVVMAPNVLVFFVAQKHFLAGITMRGAARTGF